MRFKQQIIRIVQEVVNKEIAANAKHGFYAAGLSGEGYHGGYRDALEDIIMMMNNIRPQRRSWWDGIEGFEE